MSLDYNTMQAYIDAALTDQAVLTPVFGVFSLLIIGVSITAVGLHRAGIAPFWRAILLPIGLAGVISTLDHPVLQIASGLCVATALIPTGVRQLRDPDEPLSSRINLTIAGAVAAYVVVIAAAVIASQGTTG